MTMQTNSTTPATKPQPVLVLGAMVAGAATIVSGLAIVLKDNPTAILIIGIAGVVVSGIGVAKDFYVKGQVVPAQDVVAYANDERQVITGPAAPGPDGEVVRDVLTEDYQPRHDGTLDDGTNGP